MTSRNTGTSPSSGRLAAARKRLIKDKRRLDNEELEGIHARPLSDDLFQWIALIDGPSDSPYELGTFKLSLTFDEQYPFKAPKVKFLTEVFHPNVYANGNICLDMLGNQWSATYDVISVLVSTQSLLRYPNPNSPVNNVAAQLLQENPREYQRRVKQEIEKTFCTNNK